jgi:hypothetical protein
MRFEADEVAALFRVLPFSRVTHLSLSNIGDGSDGYLAKMVPLMKQQTNLKVLAFHNQLYRCPEEQLLMKKTLKEIEATTGRAIEFHPLLQGDLEETTRSTSVSSSSSSSASS